MEIEARMTPGKRSYLDHAGPLHLAEGEYGKGRDGIWYARPPGMHMGSLENHEVTEHEDGTITVTPSILATEQNGDEKTMYHGYLIRGNWQ